MQITSAKTLVLAHYVHKGKEHFIYQYFLDLMSELKKMNGLVAWIKHTYIFEKRNTFVLWLLIYCNFVLRNTNLKGFIKIYNII